MRKFAIAMFAFVCVMSLGSDKALAQEANPAPQQVNKEVTVAPGDTLTKIANENETTYPRIYSANQQIQDPDVIHPGQKFRIPTADEQLPERPLPQKVASAPAPTPAPTPQRKQAAARPAPKPAADVPAVNIDGGVWDRLAACESGGNWAINTGNGYYGGLQFNLGTWRSNGGTGYPHQASKAEQIRVAENLRAARGFAPWPACSAKLGLR